MVFAAAPTSPRLVTATVKEFHMVQQFVTALVYAVTSVTWAAAPRISHAAFLAKLGISVIRVAAMEAHVFKLGPPLLLAIGRT